MGREFRGKDTRDDLCALPPSVETIQTLISEAASQNNHRRPIRTSIRTSMLIIVSKAYFNELAQRPVYVVLPDELLDEHERGGHMCGKLNYTLYGTPDAAES